MEEVKENDRVSEGVRLKLSAFEHERGVSGFKCPLMLRREMSRLLRTLESAVSSAEEDES